jgi:hypothetical protein
MSGGIKFELDDRELQLLVECCNCSHSGIYLPELIALMDQLRGMKGENQKKAELHNGNLSLKDLKRLQNALLCRHVGKFHNYTPADIEVKKQLFLRMESITQTGNPWRMFHVFLKF